MEGSVTHPEVILYSLSTCAYCQAIEKMLNDLEVLHDCIQVDELNGDKRDEAMAALSGVNPQCSFPTVVIGDRVITGYKAQEVKETLGIRTEIDELFDRLEKINIPKGYHFNNDRERTFELLRGLLTNKKRYGYMACPCRLASGDTGRDRDIICPCEYREPDVQEYGSCYCALYVSPAWNSGDRERKEVPERRSLEKIRPDKDSGR